MGRGGWRAEQLRHQSQVKRNRDRKCLGKTVQRLLYKGNLGYALRIREYGSCLSYYHLWEDVG